MDTVVNGKESYIAKVTYGISQGSVLGPILFALFTNDLPENAKSGNFYMYADDTTLYCIGHLTKPCVNFICVA